MLKEINLSLSLLCGGDCIFCPSERGKTIQQKIMPFDLVKKIIDEVATDEFKKKHHIRKIEIGENGDAFLNKDIIKILRYIRNELSNVSIEAFINFENFARDKAELILRENLINRFGCNIDSANEHTFRLIKKIDYEKVKKNLMDFLQLRKQLKISAPLTISVITLCAYIDTIQKNFGFYPTKLHKPSNEKVCDDFVKTKRSWKPLLTWRDKVTRLFVVGWAERKQVVSQPIDYQKYSCPNLRRVKEEAFIAPDGTWYACCLDADNVTAFGNVSMQTLEEIYSGEKRKQFIELLESKKFDRIGYPCKVIQCCQPYYCDGMMRVIYRGILQAVRKVFRVSPRL